MMAMIMVKKGETGEQLLRILLALKNVAFEKMRKKEFKSWKKGHWNVESSL